MGSAADGLPAPAPGNLQTIIGGHVEVRPDPTPVPIYL